jgi:four helix bundle protein
MPEKVQQFEDLIAWQKARYLTRSVYEVTKKDAFARDFGLKDQIRRAAVSVMSNIAEGFERNRSTEFHQYLSIAKGSCGELRSQLYVALDVGYIDEATFHQLLSQALETSRIVSGLRASVKRYLSTAPPVVEAGGGVGCRRRGGWC